ITSDGGQSVEADQVITQSGGISSGSGASGPRATFATGVQFTITDPAYGKVQAFDGPSDPMLVTSSIPGASDGSPASPGAPASNSTSPAPPAASRGGGSSPSPPPSPGASSSCQDLPTPDGYTLRATEGVGQVRRAVDCAERLLQGHLRRMWVLLGAPGAGS
ncbi:hypothetical protein ABPG77_003258, partial [Micractinium sp. CCAP 211/92]